MKQKDRDLFMKDLCKKGHLWTIQDAKVGDVLAFNDGIIVIFKDLYNKTTFHSYCHIEDGVFSVSEKDVPDWWNGEGFKIANKEQHDTLFAKMKEAGYKWNAEIKTLEKLVEAKFKIEKGKWYVCIKDLLDNYANKAFCKGDIYLSTQDGSLIPSNSNVPFEVFCPTIYFRDWTIQDAKDGDVIFYDDGWTCIFKRIHGIWFSSYCFITSDGEFHTGYERHAVDSTINGNVHLATKEQCNFLFQKIKEAGYKWNPKTKTLLVEE